MKIFKYFILLIILLVSFCSCQLSSFESNSSQSGTNNGQAGSTASFISYGGYLYTIDGSDILTFTLIDPKKPTKIHALNLGRNVETIFAYNNKLYIGSSTGVFVLKIGDKGIPSIELISNDIIPFGNDPIVVKNDIIYRTKQQFVGNENNGTLFVYTESEGNINPVFELNLKKPFGLAATNAYLYICNEEFGLDILELTDPLRPNLITTIPDIQGKDCIIDDNILIVLDLEGIAMYTLNEPTKPKFLNKLK